jgi:hypothetical protein
MRPTHTHKRCKQRMMPLNDIANDDDFLFSPKIAQLASVGLHNEMGFLAKMFSRMEMNPSFFIVVVFGWSLACCCRVEF